VKFSGTAPSEPYFLKFYLNIFYQVHSPKTLIIQKYKKFQVEYCIQNPEVTGLVSFVDPFLKEELRYDM
jgi:hypothetical protein